MTPRQRRLCIVVGVLAAVSVACALVLHALRSNLVFFYTPSQVAARQAPGGRAFRLGGLVRQGSLRRDGLAVQFDVTDFAQTIRVRYVGVLPDLFREGRGVVAQGLLGTDGVFSAQEVLAKHDERYAPPGVPSQPHAAASGNAAR